MFEKVLLLLLHLRFKQDCH